MPYSAAIDRANPSCITFVIDQSGSMADRLSESTKADTVALILNRVLHDLIIRCTTGDGDGAPRDYFDIGVIGYGGMGPENGMRDSLSQSILNPLSALYANPLRVEDRVRKVPDGAGGLVEVNSRFAVWFEPIANGGTPMVAALDLAGATISDWCNRHMSSFPPTILHLTDGESTDGNPEAIANQIMSLGTEDGGAILMNIHVAEGSDATVAFPESENSLSNPLAKQLFRMSSLLPEKMAAEAAKNGYQVTAESRCFMFNAKTEDIIQFFDIGTRGLR